VLIAWQGPGRAQDKCAAAKIKAAGAKASCLLGLESGESKKGVTGDPLKFQKCGDKESAAFAKAELKSPPCAPGGDAVTVEGQVDAFVDNVVGAIVGTTADPPLLNVCDAKEIKAAGAKAKCLLGLRSAAVKKGIAADPTKLEKCRTKMSSAFAKAELKPPPCSNPGMASNVETTVDAFVDTVAGELTPPVCGNGNVESPAETCDDSNTVDESTVHTIPPDTCPANCHIDSCTSTSGTVTVDVNFSSTASIAGYTVFVDYPEGKVVIPGSGQPGAGVITNDPTATATANDLDYGVLVVAGGINAIPPPRLFTINFTPCSGPAPVAGDFTCTVHDASDPGGNSVPMTCSVSVGP